MYYTLGDAINLQRGAASTLTWCGGGRTTEALLVCFQTMEFDPTYQLAFCYWFQKKVSETKLVPLVPAWPQSCGGDPLSAAACPLYALGVLAQDGLLNLKPSATSSLGQGKFVFPNLHATPLIIASWAGHLEVVRELLARGAAVDGAANDVSALCAFSPTHPTLTHPQPPRRHQKLPARKNPIKRRC